MHKSSGKNSRLVLRNSTTYLALCAALLVFVFNVKAQSDTLLVTNVLPEAEIMERYDWNSLNIIRQDTLHELANLASDISELIRIQGISVQQSGAPGALRLMRTSGLPAEYTQFYWNGFAINSVTNGLIDFSLLPAFIFDNLQTATSTLVGSVGSGSGGVALFTGNDRLFTSQSRFALFSDADQMNNYHAGIKFNGNVKKIYYKLKYYQALESNEFTFSDPWRHDKIVVQNHNNHYARHFLLDIGKQWGNSEVKLSSWLSGRTLNIPGQLGFYGQNDANQADSSFRFVGEYKTILGKWMLLASISRFSEIQVYRNHKLGDGSYYVNSRHHSNNTALNLLLKKENKNILKELQLQPFVASVFSTDYFNGNQTENGLFLSMRYVLKYRRIVSGIQIRQEFNNLLNPITGISLVQKLKMNEVLGFNSLIECSISSMHRRPTMNERFWSPVVNEDIRPENGWQTGFSWKLEKGSELNRIIIESSANYFELDNKIVWIYEDYWRPRNVYRAKALNLSLKVDHTRKMQFLDLDLGLVVTKSSATYKIGDLWVEAPYTPEWSMAFNLKLKYRSWILASSTTYNSSQHVDFTDSKWAVVASQFRQDFRMNYEVFNKRNELELFLAVDNASNEQYQSVYARPMPGRICRIGISIRHNRK